MNFRSSSVLLASLVLIGCGGSGGGGGNPSTTTTTLTGPNIPPSQQTSVAYDTAIFSTGHVQTARGSTTIGVNCNGLNCRYSTGDSVDLSLSLKLFDKLQRNGRVNGPHEESGTATVNGVTGNITGYAYWMGDSVFSVSNEK